MVEVLNGPTLWLSCLFLLLLGASVGSFLNVCIYRIAAHESIVHPPSHCAACGAPIPWRHNIPVLSWFLLKGRAACCGTRIDARYWMVELLTALLFLALFVWLDDLYLLAIYAFFCSGLIISSFIDIDHFIIPDRFTLGGVAAGLALSALYPPLHAESKAWDAFVVSSQGAFVGGGVTWLISVIGRLIFQKDALGFGDVKFVAAMGAFLGPLSIAWIIPVSSIVGSAIGLFILLGRQGQWGSRMPYGPFLALAAVLWIFYGGEYTRNYFENFANVFR